MELISPNYSEARIYWLEAAQAYGFNISLVRDKDGQLKVADKKQLQTLRTKLTMVFQHFNLWGHMTIIENVMEAPIHVLVLSKENLRERVLYYLAKVGIDERAQNKYPAHFSGGQQQRVSIARALAMDTQRRLRQAQGLNPRKDRCLR